MTACFCLREAFLPLAIVSPPARFVTATVLSPPYGPTFKFRLYFCYALVEPSVSGVHVIPVERLVADIHHDRLHVEVGVKRLLSELSTDT